MDDTPTPIAEIDHGPSKFEVFLEENQKLLLTSAIAIFLGVLGYVGYTGYSDMLAANAGEDLAKANGKEQLEAVIANHGNTASAGSAAKFLADLDAENATEALRNILNTYPNHAAAPSVTTSLGLQLLNEGKLDEAKAQLSAVLDMEAADHVKPIAKIALGDIAKQSGDTARAKELYTDVVNLVSDSNIESINKYSAFKSIANARIRFLDATAPTEIQKPAAPAAAETSDADKKDEKNSQVTE